MASEIVVAVKLPKNEIIRHAINESIEHHARMNNWVRAKSVDDLHRSSNSMMSEMRSDLAQIH